MSTAADWSQAFAKQASADFETWERLQRDDKVPKCHKLQFLQMACEKLAKAHLCGAGADPREIQDSHKYFAKSFPTIAKNLYARRGEHLRKYDPWAKAMGHLAREIELLAPSVKDGDRRQDNCEYPWELADDKLRIPAEYTFPNLSSLTDLEGRLLLKIVKGAIGQLT